MKFIKIGDLVINLAHISYIVIASDESLNVHLVTPAPRSFDGMAYPSTGSPPPVTSHDVLTIEGEGAKKLLAAVTMHGA